MKHLFLSALILLGLTSYQITGLTSDYSHPSDARKERVMTPEKNIDDIHDFPKVYKVSLSQVKQYIETHDKVLLYDYTPFCHSTYRVSPATLVSRRKDEGISVLVIPNIYDDIFEQKHTIFPTLMIDAKQFPTKWGAKYVEQFYFFLTGHTGRRLNYTGFHYFERRKCIKGYKNSNDIWCSYHGRIRPP